jgi:hypothetical protein
MGKVPRGTMIGIGFDYDTPKIIILLSFACLGAGLGNVFQVVDR